MFTVRCASPAHDDQLSLGLQVGYAALAGAVMDWVCCTGCLVQACAGRLLALCRLVSVPWAVVRVQVACVSN